MRSALNALGRCYRWTRVLPPVAAVERICGFLGLTARALCGPGGDIAAGSMAKAVQMLRDERGELTSLPECADFLRLRIEEGAEFDHPYFPLAWPR